MFAVEVFDEGVNPFNQFMNPENGVDLYSGSASFEELLYTLTGRGGMNVPIKLRYSSNVHLNARARNDEAPTSWVGLGWQLSYGAIKCDHKGTITHNDDEYTYVSPEGVYSKIKKFQGLNYVVSQGILPEFTGKTNNFIVNIKTNGIHVKFTGTIKIEKAGEYTFYTSSDNESILSIRKDLNWVIVVDNDGNNNKQFRTGKIESF